MTPNGNPFAPEVLAKSLHDTLDGALASIPEGHNHAVLFDGTVDATGVAVKALFVQRAPDGWNVVLEGGYDGPRGGLAGSVAVAKSW